MALPCSRETPAQMWERLSVGVSAGRLYRGRMIHTLGPKAIRQAADAGRDFVILDLEKGASSGGHDILATDVKACVQEARERHLMTFVRIGRQGPPLPLETVLPHVDAVMVSDVSAPSDLPADMHQPLIAILERASILEDIPRLVASGRSAAFCFGPHDLAASLGKPGVVADPLVVATVGEAVDRLVSLGQIVMVPERAGFELAAWRRAGVAMFVERQPVSDP